MRYRTTCAVSLLPLLILAASAALAAVAGPSVKIGALVPTTGPYAAHGFYQKVGVEMARDEINAAGGIGGVPVELILHDAAHAPQQSISLVNKLVGTDRVLAILGPFSSDQAEMAFPVANRLGVPIISCSAGKPGLSAKNRPWAFRYTFSPVGLYDGVIERWVKDHSIRTVAIMYDKKQRLFEGDGTQIFPMLLKKHNVRIVESLSFLQGDVDFSAQVTTIRAANPDGVVLASEYIEGAGILREMRRQGIVKPVTGSVPLGQEKFIELAGAAGDGTYVGSLFWAENPDPPIRDFVTRYKRVHPEGKEPFWPGVTMYDMMHVLKRLIETTGVTNRPEDLEKDRAKIRDALAGLSYRGMMGPTSMTAEGDAQFAEPLVLKIHAGKFVRLR